MNSIVIKALVILALVALIDCQQDLSFCDTSKLPADPKNLPFPSTFLDPNTKFQMTMENNIAAKLVTEELNVFYHGPANMGYAVVDEDGLRHRLYAYFDTNELLLTSGDVCNVLDLNMTIGLTPFTMTTINGLAHIATSEYSLIQNGVQFVYTGDSASVRGIPVNQWQACLYDDPSKTTIKMTVSYSNPDKWVSPMGSYNTTLTYTVPVETILEKKTADGTISSDRTSYSKFKYGLTGFENDFFTQDGVYCPKRKTTKPLPDFPDSFSFSAQFSQPLPNSEGALGTILTYKQSYDSKKLLYKMEYDQGGVPYQEIHDFKNGVRYVINKLGGGCDVSVLTDANTVDSQTIGGYLIIKDPNALFNINKTQVQYVGTKFINGINTNVWISPGIIPHGNVSLNVLYEYYFTTDQWVAQESLSVGKNDLTAVIMYMKVPVTTADGKKKYIIVTTRYNIYDFDSHRIDDFDFDITACIHQVRFSRASFQIQVDDNNMLEVLKSAALPVRKGIIEAFVQKTGISYTRIANVQSDYEDDNRVKGYFGRMFLLEKPSQVGNVQNPDTISLDAAVDIIKKSVFDGSLLINFSVNKTNYQVKIIPESLRIGDRSDDNAFCDISKIPNDPKNLPLPVLPDTQQYQVTIEKNTAESITEEITEFYDGANNIGIAYLDSVGVRIKQYVYEMTNEIIFIDNGMCVVRNLSDAIELTPFETLIVNDKPHIATPLNYLLNKFNATFVYMGSRRTIRGIPVNQWRTCIDNPKKNQTVKITISYSDPEKWIPASGTVDDKVISVPVEVEIQRQNKYGGNITTEINTFVSYKRGLLLNENDYTTPRGMYCPGRLNVKAVPKIPSSFAFRAQVTEGIPNTDGMYGLTSSIRESFDYDKKLFRIDYGENKSISFEVHDFVNGLKYKMNRFNDDCQISKLTPGIDAITDGVNLKLKDPLQFFYLDGTTTQFVGMRKVNGQNANVWIGPKKISDGEDAILEWYFQTNQWVSQESNGIATNEPILLNIFTTKQFVDQNNKTNTTQELSQFNIYNFDSKRIDDLDFDIYKCFSSIGGKAITFKINGAYKSNANNDLMGLKQQLINTIMNITAISRLRIADFDVNLVDDDDIVVSFYMLNKPKDYGNVDEKTTDKIELDTAINSLKSQITAGSFKVSFVTIFSPTSVSVTTTTVLSDSFNSKERKQDFKPKGYSSGTLTLAIILSIAGSLVIGAVGAVVVLKFACRKKSDAPITMRGLSDD